MDTTAPAGPNASFQSSELSHAAFADETAADLAANAADVALLIDENGIVQDAVFSGEEFAIGDNESWVGRKWVDLVARDSREKVTALLEAADARGERRWRHVNHVQSGADDLPVRYFTLPAGRSGWTLAIGRDLRAASRMQQRLIEAQRTMERDYARVRQAETRFRLLFQLSTEGVIILDGETFKITDVNPAAAALLGRSAQKLEGRSVDGGFGTAAAETLRETLAVARKTGQTEMVEVSPEGTGTRCVLRASVYRQERRVYFLMRLSEAGAATGAGTEPSLSGLAEILPDGLVLTDESGKILSVNNAFAEIAQLGDSRAAIGTSVDRYLGRTGTELNVLMANLREHGVIRNFATTLRGSHDLREPVEISAVAAPGPSGGTVFGFSIRTMGRRLEPESRAGTSAVPKSADELSDLIGRVALKDIVRESTDMIERKCIEAALKLTNDNRASAAEILGLSRQSLYAKMHRHGIGDLQARSDH